MGVDSYWQAILVLQKSKWIDAFTNLNRCRVLSKVDLWLLKMPKAFQSVSDFQARPSQVHFSLSYYF